MEEDCGCNKDESKSREIIITNEDITGEGIFSDGDIFDRIKKYYKNLKEEKEELEEDLLLEKLSPKTDDRELDFIEYLRNFKIKPREEFKEIKEEEVKENKEEKIEIKSDGEERKIKFIKEYLKKLKDGD